MVEVALTGGIGAGKSTVSAALAQRGAVLIDADEIGRDVQRPGGAVFKAMVQRWGDSVVADDGGLDRAAVAAIAFGDETELAALNAIVHPAIGAEMTARRRAASASGVEVVVLDVPLLVRPDGSLVPEIAAGVAGVVVVDADEETSIRRLVEQRGFSEADARARMARQASRKDRLAAADFVIDNSGTRPQLEAQIDACWTWLRSLPPPPTEPAIPRN